MAGQVYGGFTINRNLAVEGTAILFMRDSIDGRFGSDISFDGDNTDTEHDA